MEPNNHNQSDSTAKNDGATQALAREKKVNPDEAPVKQHNPGDKGLNPDQRGPAQPSGNNDQGH